MTKKSRIAISSKQHIDSRKKSRKGHQHQPIKRKATQSKQADNIESGFKKAKFTTMPRVQKEDTEAGPSKSGPSKPGPSGEKKERKSLKYMKPDLKTIKKPSKKTVFDRVKLTAAGKPNWSDIKKESMKLKQERKERKLSHYEIVVKIKKIWEIVRREDCPVDKKAENIIKLHNLVENQLDKLVYAHDTSRIIQWLIKLGSASVRAAIVDEISPILPDMMQKRFSSFCVRSIMKHGDDKAKAKVVEAMKGSVLKLLTNSASAPLFEQVYSQHASASQKVSMEQEFLGSFVVTINAENTKSIADILKELNAENKSSVFETMKENITKVVTKGNVGSSIVCNVSLQLLEACSQEDKQEVLALFSPHILDIMGTKAGSRLSMHTIWNSDKKVRKQIVKSIKGQVTQIAMAEYSYWIILALLDSVDDTVLLNKVIVAEIAVSATTLVKSEYGRKVLLYLVAHRDTVYFHPDDIRYLEQGDTSTFCLKSISTKREELSPVINDLLQNIRDNIGVWMQDAKVAMVTLATLKKGTGKILEEALCALAKHICSEVTIESQPLIENPGMNLILKKLLKFDETRKDDTDKFCVQLANILEEETISKWITCNRGAFLLVGILEAKTDKAIQVLTSKITTNTREQIKNEKNIGAKVLDKVLSESSAPS